MKKYVPRSTDRRPQTEEDEAFAEKRMAQISKNIQNAK